MNSCPMLACFHTHHEGRFGSICAKLVSTRDAAKECQQICTASYTKRYALQVSATSSLSVTNCAVSCEIVQQHLCGFRRARMLKQSQQDSRCQEFLALEVSRRLSASMTSTTPMLSSKRQSWRCDIVEATI